MKITDLCPEPESREITLRGKTLTVSPMVIADDAALDAQLPEPDTGEDRDAALKMPRVQKAMTEYRVSRRTAIAGICAGIENSKGEAWTRDRDGAWVRAWAGEIQDRMTTEEVFEIYKAQSFLYASQMSPDGERIGDGENAGKSSARSVGEAAGAAGNSPNGTASLVST